MPDTSPRPKLLHLSTEEHSVLLDCLEGELAAADAPIARRLFEALQNDGFEIILSIPEPVRETREWRGR